MHFTDAQQNIRRRQKHTEKQTGFHGENAVFMEKLERANDYLFNMVHTDMTYKEQITNFTRTLAELTKRFGVMEAKLEKVLAGHTGVGTSTVTHKHKKDVMGPAYWKADGKHILDQVGYCYIHGYCMKPAQNSTRCNHSWQSQGHIDKATREDTMGGLSWGNPKILWKRGIVAKNIVNKFSKINLINNTTT